MTTFMFLLSFTVGLLILFGCFVLYKSILLIKRDGLNPEDYNVTNVNKGMYNAIKGNLIFGIIIVITSLYFYINSLQHVCK